MRVHRKGNKLIFRNTNIRAETNAYITEVVLKDEKTASQLHDKFNEFGYAVYDSPWKDYIEKHLTDYCVVDEHKHVQCSYLVIDHKEKMCFALKHVNDIHDWLDNASWHNTDMSYLLVLDRNFEEVNMKPANRLAQLKLMQGHADQHNLDDLVAFIQEKIDECS